ncbi:MAG: hypothetical protein M3O50_06485 [Myxococcota bacterium]|nr:hypothetical protein [Myxococcota bacterium]
MQTRLMCRASFVALVLSGGCSSNTAGPYSDVSGFCQQKAKAECQYAPKCAVPIATCEAYRASVCNRDATVATASGARKYSSANAQACVDAWNAAYTKNSNEVSFMDLVGRNSITDRCERVFSGNVASGNSCTVDYDCANDRVCASASPGSPKKVCADAVATTMFCSNPGQVCPTDMYCAVEATSGTAQCQPAAAAGQACSASVPCVSTQRCVAGTCQDRTMAGTSCTSNDDCPAVDPYCDPYASGKCTAGLTFATGAADCAAWQGGSPGTSSSGSSSGAASDAAVE